MKGQANNLTAAELRAIEEHKYYLSQQRGTEVSIEEAIDDFIQHFAEDWRKEKLRPGQPRTAGRNREAQISSFFGRGTGHRRVFRRRGMVPKIRAHLAHGT